jgi:hypothetical protein
MSETKTREVGEFSDLTYEELIERVKGNETLTELVNCIFASYEDVVVYNNPWDWDVGYGEMTLLNEDMMADGVKEEEAWLWSDLEVLYGKTLHTITDPTTGERKEGEYYNWKDVMINKDEVVVVRDESDYIAIDILDFSNMVEGLINP